ncbi:MULTISPECIES: hypothetical protein [unclassified Pseudomonas]|uniref:hypothetical protein n=1 Tax=unclassified Pseudomonas TaxID=196821 RepID=UPI000BC9ABF1|nr:MULTISPECIES: hypothetical protein [unclassified Pseudomonas]PVZ19964.1 hypothetical protein F474_00555 [Pseudomonas sp. URIL14HWK12:I12]PVZ27030.1 hypothetical protein F470_00210 [Pseudomonas sp. URIL14HWK12:I10]PVZ37919.1 hypothetical protein F472_00555 [Pseudomonas sp. URIL14HWK12:I11]SNZ05143.1 hypothetical protein SAMN05660463_00849 [Pseudomonas sp. URIL14HWK12:I9]
MAMTQAERSAKAAGKRQAAQEEELRLRVRPGTKQALADLMAWAELEEQGEALTLMIHHLQALGPAVAVRFLTPPRHEITVSENVAQKLEAACRRQGTRIGSDLIRDFGDSQNA